MSEELSLKQIQKEWHGTLKAYIIGFIGSLVLTIISFSLVHTKIISGQTLLYTVVSLALVQAVIQLLFFLHVGQEAKPRWETVVFLFMLMVLVIVAFGTLWIMQDLDARMMSDMPRIMPYD